MKPNRSELEYKIKTVSVRGMKGKHHSEESKNKMRKAALGRKISSETREKLSKALMGKNKGKKHSEETILKFRSKMKGRIISEETKNKMSKARLGRKLSEETKRKIGIANKGNKISEEQKKIISKAHLGIKLSEETKKKISQNNGKYWLGKKRSKETNEKIRISNSGGQHSGKKCNFWKGGIAYEPYAIDWTRTLKRSIRERDKYTCQICGKPQEEEAHNVHHIDYNKKNCNPDNLITLCRNCHSKTNNNREFYKKYLKERTLKNIKNETKKYE